MGSFSGRSPTRHQSMLRISSPSLTAKVSTNPRRAERIKVTHGFSLSLGDITTNTVLYFYKKNRIRFLINAISREDRKSRRGEGGGDDGDRIRIEVSHGLFFVVSVNFCGCRMTVGFLFDTQSSAT